MKKYDIIVIGGGIAGMTASIYARRANKSVLIVEAGVNGGQITQTYKIENWPGEKAISGAELAEKIYSRTKDLGAEFKSEEVLKVSGVKGDFIVETDEDKYSAEAIIIAVGAKERKLGLPREEELTGRGIGYCATCDGAFYKGKDVAVIGGGNTALNDALYLADIASKVYLVHRRDEFRGDAILVDRIKAKDNIELVLNSQPAEFVGEKRISGLKVINKSDEERLLDVSGVFIAVGQVPETGIFKDLIEINPQGYIVAGEDCCTSAPGVYVAGDCRVKSVRQLVTAAADGAVAATAAVQNLTQ